MESIDRRDSHRACEAALLQVRTDGCRLCTVHAHDAQALGFESTTHQAAKDTRHSACLGGIGDGTAALRLLDAVTHVLEADSGQAGE